MEGSTIRLCSTELIPVAGLLLQRGLMGLGQYTIIEKYTSLMCKDTIVHYLPTCSPSEVVKLIKEGTVDIIETCTSLPEVIILGYITLIFTSHSLLQKECDTFTSVKPSRFLSTKARAKLVLKEDNITFDTKLHVFNVKGLSGTTRVVTLFPKQSCSCPSMGGCYHLVAAKLCAGMHVSFNKDANEETTGAGVTRRVAGRGHVQRIMIQKVV